MEVADLRAQALDIFAAALDAAHPHELIHETLSLQGTVLKVEGMEERGVTLDLNEVGRIVAVGAGKATAPMAAALEELLEDRLEGGVISVKYGHAVPIERIQIREAGHPLPDENGVAATAEIIETLESLEEGDLAFVLLSGGGSALLAHYPEGISLKEAQQTFDTLLASGAPIHDMNVVRKHISSVKGGQLARVAQPARLIALVLSDVIGDPLPIIASGPTVPDPSTFAQALEILDERGARERIPDSVLKHLELGAAGQIAETPKPGESGWEDSHTVLIGSIRRAVEAAADRARMLGLRPRIITTRMDGEARDVGKNLVKILERALETGEPASPPFCLIAGGETTVTIEGDCGRGGRNQELALSAALSMQDMPGAVLLSGGTDGTDGPTDAAGGVVDGGTVERGRAVQMEVRDHLEGHDAYPYLEATGGLIKTGPTMTNVMDMVLMVARADKE
jgi:hydroxypyruvate reductase